MNLNQTKIRYFDKLASEKQIMLVGLLCAETIAYTMHDEGVERCREVLFAFINDKATKEELNQAKRDCYDPVTYAAVLADASLAVYDVASGIAATCCHTSASMRAKEAEIEDLLFSEKGPIHQLIPDFDNVPSLEQMLLNYPKAVEIAKGLFNKKYVAADTAGI